jgi:hypothetical protein
VDALLVARPELGDEAERIAGELLSVVSVEQIAAAVLDQAANLRLMVPDDAPASHWPRWSDLW